MNDMPRGLLLVIIGIILLIAGPGAVGGIAGTVIAVVAALITCTGAYLTWKERRGV